MRETRLIGLSRFSVPSFPILSSHNFYSAIFHIYVIFQMTIAVLLIIPVLITVVVVLSSWRMFKDVTVMIWRAYFNLGKVGKSVYSRSRKDHAFLYRN